MVSLEAHVTVSCDPLFCFGAQQIWSNLIVFPNIPGEGIACSMGLLDGVDASKGKIESFSNPFGGEQAKLTRLC